MQVDDIDNSRIVEDVHISSELTNDVIDDLVKSSMLTLDETHVHEENISDVQDTLVESSTYIPDDIDVLEDDTSDFKHVLVESSSPYRLLGIHLSYL